ncbi:hypothetical protein HDU96_001438 [Phlyctochytrium bullatum]|nr:hypothetical protein HDU96_001438 [Phlyctochytrium bullatum]
MKPFTAIAATAALASALIGIAMPPAVVAQAVDNSTATATDGVTSTDVPAATTTAAAAAPAGTPATGSASDFSKVPLAPPTGQVLLGAWYMRAQGDPAKDVNARLTGIPGAGLSFFQTDVDITDARNDPGTTLNITDSYLQELEETGTDALAYLTVYPFRGYNTITDAQLQDLGRRLLRIIQSGRSVFLRLYPEMNGSWFNFGQDPVAFIEAWRRAYNVVTQVIGSENRSKIAFVWAPNSGNGYPFTNGAYSPVPGNATDDARIRALDTNGDGLFNGSDSPYTPYYPGDEYVDWVGLSIYHYGRRYPWVTNDIPEENKFEGLLQGQFDPYWGTFAFYTEFSSSTSSHNKPFFLAEGGAAYHLAYVPASASKYSNPVDITTVPREAIKRAFWRQFLNKDFLAKYPNFRAVSTFEFMKSEEDTVRDFTNFGVPGPNKPNMSFAIANAAGADDTLKAFVEDSKSMDFIRWAKTAPLPVTSTSRNTAAPTATTKSTPAVSASVDVSTATGTAAANKNAAAGSWSASSLAKSVLAVVVAAAYVALA